ncbi:MAG: hypothetical protein MK052_04440 [Alphaproteobacteria bacterium]|nr:hypothetical protein [Alphaproteobacteria bacterium]
MRKGFRSKRGRPAVQRAATDHGTPELTAKRAVKATSETIDYLFENKFINDRHLWCALHLRWLYELRYGTPFTKAVDLTQHSQYCPPNLEEPEWRKKYHDEYKAISAKLHSKGFLIGTLRLCVFNDPSYKHLTKSELKNIPAMHGLELLVNHWQGNN